MDMTFKDYMLACENYEHSRENLELMKESAEITVLNQYIENQLFAQENASLYENAALAECLTESVDEGNFEAICESAKNKSEGFIKKIYNGLAKIVKVFSSLLKKIGNIFDETTKHGQELIKTISQATFDEKSLKKLETICDKASTKSNGFVPFLVQPYAKNIRINTNCEDMELVNRVRAKLAAALSNTTVKADVSAFNNQTIGALPVEDIMDIKMGLILNPKNRKFKVAIKSLSASWLEAKTKGITIQVNTKAIDKSADQLSELQTQITDLVNKKFNTGLVNEGIDRVVAGLQSVNNKAENTDTNTNTDGKYEGAKKFVARVVDDLQESPDALNELYSLVNMTIGSSMRVYSGLNTYRKTVIAALYSDEENGVKGSFKFKMNDGK